MSSTSPKKNTDKQVAKFNRQKCIALLEQMTKSLFRMFRTKTTTKEQMMARFSVMDDKLKKLGEVYLDSEYLRAMKSYIDKVPQILASAENLDEIRDINMTRLNRIQKIKNETEYKKDKHTKKFEV